MVSKQLVGIFGNILPQLGVLGVVPSSKTIHPSKWHQRKTEAGLVTWFDMAYFLLLCPYRFQVQSDRIAVLIKNNPLQKGCCMICNFICITFYFAEFRQSLVELSAGPNNPVKYLNIFLALVSLIHHGVFVYTLWTKPLELSKIIQNFISIDESLLLDKLSPKVLQHWSIILICLTYPLMSLLTAPAVIDLFSSPEVIAKEFVSRVKFNLFLQPTYGVNQTLIAESIANGSFCITKSDAAFLALFFVMFLLRNSMGFCTDALLLMMCLSLWFPAKQISTSISKVSNEKGLDSHYSIRKFKNSPTIGKRIRADVVMDQYETLKNISKLLNGVFGPLLLTFVLEGTLYYSVTMKNIMILHSPLSTVWLGFFFVSFALIFFIAADINYQAESFKEWLADDLNREWLSDRELQYFMFELQGAPIGLKSAGVFAFNFSFVATVCSSLMTYFIVTVQFE